jgi:hypothetical protein
VKDQNERGGFVENIDFILLTLQGEQKHDRGRFVEKRDLILLSPERKQTRGGHNKIEYYDTFEAACAIFLGHCQAPQVATLLAVAAWLMRRASTS